MKDKLFTLNDIMHFDCLQSTQNRKVQQIMTVKFLFKTGT